jgi:hypothetical protein
MDEADIHPTVWINHGNEANVANFGGYNPFKFTRYQAGDDKKSIYYHTDITLRKGIRFVWNSIGDDRFGHDWPLFDITLRDGQKVWGFYRYTHDKKAGQYHWVWSPAAIYRQVTQEKLDKLVEKKQYAILAQHFGSPKGVFPFSQADIDRLRMIATYQEQGKILVARTSRLLQYAVAQRFVQYSMVRDGDTVWINISSIKDPVLGSRKPSLDEVRGLTFYIGSGLKQVYILVDFWPIESKYISLNPKDESMSESVSIKWFEPNYTDFTK